MYHIFKVLAYVLLFIAVFVNMAHASDNKGTISGTVTDSDGHPLPAVNVSLPQLNKGAITDIDGKYKITTVSTGTYTISFSLVGYRRENRTVDVKIGDTVVVDVQMTQTVLESESITVTGSPYASDPLEVAADVSAINGEEKIQQQSASLGASLENMSGVTNISTGSQVGKPVIRGLSGNRIRVMSNGTPMDYQQFGVRHMPNVDPLLAERIEVVRGASSVLYGSDALGGVVNIIPRRPPLASEQRASLRGQVYSSYATANLERMGAVRLEGSHGKFGWTSTLVRRKSGNMHTPDVENYSESGEEGAPKFTSELDHTNYEQLNGHFGFGYSTSYGQIDGYYTRWNSEQNFLLPTGEGQGQYLSNDILQLRTLITSFDNWLIRGKLTYSHNLRKATQAGVDYEDLADDNIAVNLVNDSYTARVEMEHSNWLGLNGRIGAEYSLQDKSTLGPEPLLPAATVQNVGIFALEEKGWNRFKLSVGLRFDVRNQEAEANEKMNLPDYQDGETDDILSQNYQVFSGSIGTTYKLTDRITLASNISRGFRAPGIFELHVDGVHGGVAAYQVGDPGLQEELSLNTDLSLRWRSDRFSGKATVYRNGIENYIYLQETDQTRNNLRVWETVQGDARLYGANAEIQYSLARGVLLKASYEMVRGELTATDQELPLLPADKFSSTVKFMRRELAGLQDPYISVTARYSASKKAAGTYEPFSQFDRQPFGTASTDAYGLLDLHTGFAFTVADHRARVDLAAENLLNNDYRDFLDTYKGYALGAGRNVSVKLSIPFDIAE